MVSHFHYLWLNSRAMSFKSATNVKIFKLVFTCLVSVGTLKLKLFEKERLCFSLFQTIIFPRISPLWKQATKWKSLGHKGRRKTKLIFNFLLTAVMQFVQLHFCHPPSLSPTKLFEANVISPVLYLFRLRNTVLLWLKLQLI